MESTLKQIAERLRRAKNVAVFSHMNPDGDAYGSALALSSALENLGINTQVCVETDTPSNLLFIDGLDKVTKAPTREYDLLVCVDCSDVQRLGALAEEFLVAKRKKIDTTDDKSIDVYADENAAEAETAETTEQVEEVEEVEEAAKEPEPQPQAAEEPTAETATEQTEKDE